MKIFWSWQSDRDPELHHYFVRDALKLACKQLAGDPEFEEAERPEVDHDMKGALGTQDIAATILMKIAGANAFVADMTPVGMTDPASLGGAKKASPKHLQNPNVMSELGYAERALGTDKIILVANAAHYPGPEALPFDWRHRSGAKTYHLPDGATEGAVKAELQKFAGVLKAHLKPILLAQQPPPPEPTPAAWKAATEADKALWLGGEKLEYRNSSLSLPGKVLALADGPRFYARVVPSKWAKVDKQKLADRVVELSMRLGGNSGDWGINGAGALSVWGSQGVAYSATQWFQDTGEIWGTGVAGFSAHQGKTFFAYQAVFRELDRFLEAANTGLAALGSGGHVTLRMGLSNVQGTVWPPASGGWGAAEALGGAAEVEVGADLSVPSDRRQALRRLWDEIADLYGVTPSPDVAHFEQAAGLPPL